MIYERFWPWWFAEWRRLACQIWNLLRCGIGYWPFMIRHRKTAVRVAKRVSELRPFMSEPVDLSQKIAALAASLAPDVLYIRWNEGKDWEGKPALFFRVLLSDDAGQCNKTFDRIQRSVVALLSEDQRFPYFNFRTESEQRELNEPEWRSS